MLFDRFWNESGLCTDFGRLSIVRENMHTVIHIMDSDLGQCKLHQSDMIR